MKPMVPPDRMKVPVPELPTYWVYEVTERLPPVICTVPPPALLPSESVPQVSPTVVTVAVPPLTI